MMRYKPERKGETRRRIVESAAKDFRAHGFERVGIAGVMGDLNLTHGGFYAHFADKEELVTESCALMMGERLEIMLSGLEAGGFPAVLDFYLSEAHRDQPAAGCLLPALAAELARRPTSSREAFTRKLSETINALAERMPGQTAEQKHAKVCVMFASLTGAVTLARAVTDANLSKSILESTRENLLRLIEE